MGYHPASAWACYLSCTYPESKLQRLAYHPKSAREYVSASPRQIASRITIFQLFASTLSLGKFDEDHSKQQPSKTMPQPIRNILHDFWKRLPIPDITLAEQQPLIDLVDRV